MAIRYDAKLNSDINKVVRNFNRKVSRLQSQDKKLIGIDKVSVKNLKDSFTDRRELKRKLSELQRFSKRGAEEVIRTEGGALTTRYELDNLKRNSRRAKYILTRQINQLQRSDARYPMMRSVQLNNLMAKRNYLSRNINKLNDLRYYRKINKQYETAKSSQERFKDNMLDMLFKEAKQAGVPLEDINRIEKKLRQLTPEQLYEAYNDSGEMQYLVERYPDFMDVTELKHSDLTAYKLVVDNLNSRVDEILAKYKD